MNYCEKHREEYEPDVLKAMNEMKSNCCGKCSLEETKKRTDSRAEAKLKKIKRQGKLFRRKQ